MKCSWMEIDCMKYIDGEMNERDRADFEMHLEGCAKCREILQDFQELKSLTGRIKMRDPTDEFWDGYWRSLYRRIERKTGWLFIVLGAAMLVTYGAYRAVQSFGTITFEKVAIAVFLIGVVILLISVIRERIHQHKTDPYKKVKR